MRPENSISSYKYSLGCWSIQISISEGQIIVFGFNNKECFIKLYNDETNVCEFLENLID
jgi:hypothetical protein